MCYSLIDYNHETSKQTDADGSGTLLLGGGVYLSYLQARPVERLSDLMPANIEALSSVKESDGGVVLCSGGEVPCANVYDQDGNVIDQLTMP